MPENNTGGAPRQGHGPMRGGPMGGPMGGMRGGDKAKDFGSAMKKLLAYCKKYFPFILAALVLACAGAVLTIVGPGKLGDMTDLIFQGLMAGIDLEAVVRIAVTLVVLYGLGALFNYAQGFIMATVTQRISKSLRGDISQKINRLPLGYFDSNSYGDVLSRVTNDVDTIGQTLNNSMGALVSAVTLFFGTLIMMFAADWIMALSGIGATLLGFALMTVIMSKSQKYFTAQQRVLGQINGHVEETYSGHTVVKAYNGEKAAEETFDEINGRLYENAWKSQFMSGLMQPVMMFVGNFGYVTVCIVGALLVINGRIEFGVIVSFMLYIRFFTQPLAQLAQAATNLQATAAAAERVFQFLAETELADESGKTRVLSGAEGNVDFRDVSFGYDKNKPVIKNFSASAKSGQKIAIVGPTGAGKTTLVNLLMRFYEVDSGEILIDGIPTRELTRENVHDLFCMVLQDTWLFEGTIRENIVYSKTGVTDEELRRACGAVGLDHFISSLPEGYDTVLSDKANLSEGQRQLMTIARAMVENAPMLILDEATSSVDTRTELQIQAAMDRLMAGRTSFIIAHRLSTIKNADLILVVRDGNIVETGNHEALLAKGGFYAELWKSQFEAA